MRLRLPVLLLSFAATALLCPAAEKAKPAPAKPKPATRATTAMATNPPMAIPATFPAHPRLLFGKEDLAGIRERAETTDWGRAELTKIRKNAERWLTNQIVLPERGGQWPHHYVCAKDGGRLKTQSPTQHVCQVCGQIYSGWPYDDVVLGSRHSALAGGLLDCGIMFQLSGDRRFANKAKEILLAYAAKYQSYPLHNIKGQAAVGGAKMSAQTLDEAMLLIPMAQGADCIWEALSPEEQRRAADGLFRPAAAVIRQHRMGIHNIQCWKNSAVGVTGLLLGDPELINDAINNPAYGYLAQMAQGVQRDGVWYEGAWGYHFFTIGAIWPLTEAAKHCGIDLYGKPFRSMFEAPLNLAMPNLTLPAFNDSTEGPRGGGAYLEATREAVEENSYGQSAAAIESFNRIRNSGATDSIRMNLDRIEVINGRLYLDGWAFIDDEIGAADSTIFIVVREPQGYFLIEPSQNKRPDVTAYFNNGRNYDDSGFTGITRPVNLSTCEITTFIRRPDKVAYIDIRLSVK